MADKRLRLLVEAVTSNAQQKLRSFGNAIQQFGDQASRRFDVVASKTKGLGGALTNLQGVATVALGMVGSHYAKMALDATVNLAQVAAQNLAVADSFEAVADRYGVGSDRIIEAIQRASKNTIDKFSAMGAASTAMRLGVATNVDEFEKLMKIAYMRARETGTGVEEAWGWITRGIGRASPFILDNLNFLVGTNDVLEDHARLLDKTVDDLSKLERQEALRNYVLEQGADDLERWNEIGEDAADVFAQNRAAAAEFRQELGEQLLPAVIAVTRAMTELITIGKSHQAWLEDQEEAVFRTASSYEEAAMRLSKLQGYQQAGGRWAREGTRDWQEQTATLAAWEEVHERVRRSYSDIDIKFHDAQRAAADAGDATEDLTEDLEEQQKALEKGADIWADYLRDVAEENWQYARRVEDAQFSMRQAAEKASFDLMKVERDAADRRGDLLETAAIRVEAETARHYNKLRYMRQDLADDLADMEWDYQRERQRALDQAPRWIRYALSRELGQRESIAATGDKKALEQFDAMLNERIKAIDPAYAKELELLEEQHEHEEDIERREARQAQQREKDAWRISSREQRLSLNQQLNDLSRNLDHRLEEWHFHERQREESERWSMDRVITDHDHSLGRMYETTQRKLAEMVPLWEHYGQEYIMALIRGMATGQMMTPMPAGGWPTLPTTPPAFPPHLQMGMWEVPRRMLAMIDRGEMVVPAGPAERMRQGGGITIEIGQLVLSGAGGPNQARRQARELAEELGPMMKQRSR